MAPRETDAVVTLERGGWIEGFVLGDELVRPDLLRVQANAEPADGDARLAPARFQPFRPHATRPRGDATFLLGPLPVGSFRVGIFPAHDPEPLAEIEDVRVTAGETTRDARLNPVDLRGRLHELALRVVDVDGVPIGPFSLQSWPSGGSAERAAELVFPGGRSRLVAHSPEVDVLVRAIGYRSARFERVRSGAELVLTPGCTARIALAGAPPLGASEQLWVELVPDTDDLQGGPLPPGWRRTDHKLALAEASEAVLATDERGASEGYVMFVCYSGLGPVGQPLDSKGETVFRLGEPGRYRVGWNLVTTDSGEPTLVGAPAGEPLEVIELDDAAGEQVFSVHLRPEQLERLRRGDSRRE